MSRDKLPLLDHFLNGVTYLFSRYLFIVVLVIYSLLKTVAKKGRAGNGSGPKAAVYLYWYVTSL